MSILLTAWLVWTFVLAGPADAAGAVPLPVLWAGLYGPVLPLFVFWLLWAVQSERGAGVGYSTAGVILGYVCLLLINAVVSNAALPAVGLALRDALRNLVLLFPLIAWNSGWGRPRALLEYAAYWVALQPAVVFGQFVLVSSWRPADTNGGTLGAAGTGELMAIVVCAIAVLAALWHVGYRRRFVTLFALWLTPIIPLAGAFAGFLLLPFGVILGVAGIGLRHWLARLTVVSAMCVGLLVWVLTSGAFARAIDKTGSYGAALLWSIEALSSPAVDSVGSPGRLYALNELWQSLRSDGRLLIGRGLGSTSMPFSERVSFRAEARSPVVFATSLTRTLAETGVIGVVSYLALVLTLWLEVRRRRRWLTEPLWRGLYSGYTVCVVLHVVLGAYQTSWGNTWSSFVPFLLTAILLGRARAVHAREVEEVGG